MFGCGTIDLMLYRVTSDIHSELWPESAAKAKKLLDIYLPPMAEDSQTTLLLAGDTGSYRRRVMYGWVIERLCARFEKVIDIPGNHYYYWGHGLGNLRAPCPTPELSFRRHAGRRFDHSGN